MSLKSGVILLTETQGPSHHLGGSNYILEFTVYNILNTVV